MRVSLQPAEKLSPHSEDLEARPGARRMMIGRSAAISDV
jgi:hypothetical protein